MQTLNVNLILVLLSLHTAVFVYVGTKIVEYLDWKRKRLENSNV